MDITLFISSLSGGGAERVVANIANFLSEKNHKVTVLTVSGLVSYQINSKVKHEILCDETKKKLPHIIINIIRLYKLNKYLRKTKTDVYLTFLPVLTKMLLLQKKFIDAPVIMAERGNPETFFDASSNNKAVFKRIYPKADGYVFQTQWAQEYYMQKGVPVEQSIIIPNAINPECIRKKYVGPKENIIVGAGRLTKQKNFELLIDSFKNVKEKHKEFSLVIYGEGPERRKLENKIELFDLQDSILLPGYVSDLGAKLEKSTMFVLSSDYEGMPNALMEAMAVGLPVISTDCPAGGSRFLIENGKNGILVPVKDTVKLEMAMCSIIENFENAEIMSQNARSICERLASHNIYEQWESYIKCIVKRSVDTNKTRGKK
ncbi:MAG: glycosyltransferase family 4 protein [bacterium]|nr:glycosyltransferase family 4 protein [bacterium]